MNQAILRPEDLRVGDILVTRVGMRRLDTEVLQIDMVERQFRTSFGWVPFASLAMMTKKEPNV